MSQQQNSETEVMPRSGNRFWTIVSLSAAAGLPYLILLFVKSDQVMAHGLSHSFSVLGYCANWPVIPMLAMLRLGGGVDPLFLFPATLITGVLGAAFLVRKFPHRFPVACLVLFSWSLIACLIAHVLFSSSFA